MEEFSEDDDDDDDDDLSDLSGISKIYLCFIGFNGSVDILPVFASTSWQPLYQCAFHVLDKTCVQPDPEHFCKTSISTRPNCKLETDMVC